VHTLTAPPVTGTTVMHLALSPAPPLKRVVEVTDLLRAAALSRLDWTGHDSMLAGKTRDGDAMRGHRHAHAHWLPVTDGQVIAGICLWTPGGLSPAETAAVAAVRRVGSDRPGSGPLPAMRITLLHGSRPLPARLTGPSAAWESLTPFSPPRRADRPNRWTPEFLHREVARELECRGLPAPALVRELGPVAGWQTRRPSRPEWVPPPRRIRIEFTEPATGPLAIGRLGHFGLGILAPA
jgi:CRISPR-associated protein Csb2